MSEQNSAELPWLVGQIADATAELVRETMVGSSLSASLLTQDFAEAGRHLLSQGHYAEVVKIILAANECLTHSVTDEELKLDTAGFARNAALRGRSFLTYEKLTDIVARADLNIAEKILESGLLVSDGQPNIPLATNMFGIFQEASFMSCGHALQQDLAQAMEKCVAVVRSAGGEDLARKSMERVETSTISTRHPVYVAAAKLLKTFPVSTAG